MITLNMIKLRASRTTVAQNKPPSLCRRLIAKSFRSIELTCFHLANNLTFQATNLPSLATACFAS